MTNAVKFANKSRGIIEGLAIPFGGPFAGKDFDGEDFGPDTDYALDWFPTGRPLLYHHGRDTALKTSIVGRQTEHELRDDGIWVTAQLDQSAKYRSMVESLIDQKALGFSSGAMPALVETTKDGHITRWPWVELSLTPTPANPYAAVYAVKATAALDHLNAVGEVPPVVEAALKALDEWSGSGSDLPGRIEAVSADVRELASDAQRHALVRAKDGRFLGRAWKDRLGPLPDSLRALATLIDGVLTDATPDANQDAALAALARFAQIDAALNGVGSLT